MKVEQRDEVIKDLLNSVEARHGKHTADSLAVAVEVYKASVAALIVAAVTISRCSGKPELDKVNESLIEIEKRMMTVADSTLVVLLDDEDLTKEVMHMYKRIQLESRLILVELMKG